MTIRDIIGVQLERLFGDKFPHKIQRLVDEELTQGRWVDGYDLAICKGVIEGDDARRLLEIILNQHPQLRLDERELLKQVEERLPQARVLWIGACSFSSVKRTEPIPALFSSPMGTTGV